MGLPLKESHACSEMAKIIYRFLPGSGAKSWTGHVTFQTVAREIGVGHFWQGGSKEPSIAVLLEKTLEQKRSLFENLIIQIVRNGIRYCGKQGFPITEDEIKKLNGLLLDVGFKFPELWDSQFLSSLRIGASDRAAEMVEKELSAEKVRQLKTSANEQARQMIRLAFYELSAKEDRQAAGRDFEKVLNELFQLSDLKPREPFRVVGEQIDGSFELDNEVYLVEAKWEKKLLSEAPLMVFREKIQGKSNITRGVLIALNGCTGEALDAITRGKQPNFFLIDGYDLVSVLEGTLSLKQLLRAKIRCLAEEGRLLLSASKILTSKEQGFK